MSNPTSDRVRGELLRQWRFSQKWDVTLLARRVNLSIGQIHQLETGGHSLFYSAAIRENAARKVAAALGADPESVIRPNEAGQTDAQRDAKVVDELIELTRKRTKAAKTPPILARHPGLIAMLVLPAVVLIAASGWLQQKWQNGGAAQFWRQSALSSSRSTQVQAPAHANIPEPVLGAASAASNSGVAIRAVALTSEPASSAVLSTDAVAVVNGSHLCQQASAADTVITPVRPSKPGDMVYIVAHKMGSVCVVDGAGVSTLLSLKVKEARSVYGTAPWRVNFEQPEQAQLYFQGERLRLPDNQATTVALQESPRAQ